MPQSNRAESMNGHNHSILDIVAINDVLTLKAARRDTIANFKCFGTPTPRYKQPNFDGVVYIHYAAPPHLARGSAIYHLPFGKVWLGSASVCNARQRSRTHRPTWRRMGENWKLRYYILTTVCYRGLLLPCGWLSSVAWTPKCICEARQ